MGFVSDVSVLRRWIQKSRSELIRHSPGDTYADHNNFVIRSNNSKYFVEEEIAKAKECGKPLPSDLLKYVQLTYSRGGKLKKKKTTLLDTYDDDDFQAPKVKKN